MQAKLQDKRSIAALTDEDPAIAAPATVADGRKELIVKQGLLEPSTIIPLDEAESYSDDGFLLLRGVLDDGFFAPFEAAFLDLLAVYTGRRFPSLHDSALQKLLDENRALESQVYDAVRGLPEMQALGRDPRMGALLERAMPGRTYRALSKMILRIDLPNWAHEVAHWHQDHFYVRGNTETITAWIPLQDVNARNGCLAISPGSHARGPMAHDRQIGKRHCPSEDRLSKLDVLRVPMARGDVLLFHALLLHAGQVNTSDHSRYSFQFRYTPAGLPTDPAMGELLSIDEG